jgi:N-acetylglutamate synthase-like GNAT family acetyltransferase
MRGQRLFVRAIEPEDHDQVRRFLQSHCGHQSVPACGLLGKLAGNLVAVLGMHITADAVQITDIVVAAELRRKRIGRVMVSELEQMASKTDCRRLVVEGPWDAPGFLQRIGFDRDGERWIRRLGP